MCATVLTDVYNRRLLVSSLKYEFSLLTVYNSYINNVLVVRL